MVGISLALVGISMVIVQAKILGIFVTRFGERRTAQIAMAFGLVTFIMLASIANGWIILSFMLINGFSGMGLPAINAMMSRRMPVNQQGELQGFNGSLAALAIMFAQIVYNNVLSYYTGNAAPIYFPGAPFVIAAGLALIALIMVSILPKTAAKDA